MLTVSITIDINSEISDSQPKGSDQQVPPSEQTGAPKLPLMDTQADSVQQENNSIKRVDLTQAVKITSAESCYYPYAASNEETYHAIKNLLVAHPKVLHAIQKHIPEFCLVKSDTSCPDHISGLIDRLANTNVEIRNRLLGLVMMLDPEWNDGGIAFNKLSAEDEWSWLQ